MRILYVTLLIFSCSIPNTYAAKIIEHPEEGYYVVLPNSITHAKESPVLICLPGWGVKARQDINVWAFSIAKRGFLGIGIDIDYSTVASIEEVKALNQRIKNIINSLSVNYTINRDKLYIAGTSAGGMMAISLALHYLGEFKAIGVVSGGRLAFGVEGVLKNAKGQLFYLLHGQKDKSIPMGEFYSTKKKLEANGAVIEFKVIPEGAHTLSSGYYKEVVDWFYQLSELLP